MKSSLQSKLRSALRQNVWNFLPVKCPEEIQDNLIDAIFACQNGVTRMIPTVPDTVETSSNLAIITIGGGKAEIKILARSSSDSMKEYLTTSLESCFSMAGMKVEMTGGYSGWQPNVESPILHAMKANLINSSLE